MTALAFETSAPSATCDVVLASQQRASKLQRVSSHEVTVRWMLAAQANKVGNWLSTLCVIVWVPP